MKKYIKPDMSITFVKNTDIISVSSASIRMGGLFNKEGIKYKMVNFK